MLKYIIMKLRILPTASELNKEHDDIMIRRQKRIANSYHPYECAGCGEWFIAYSRKPKIYECCSPECREIVEFELAGY